MELNRIYRYYSIPRDSGYAHVKEKFTEAFTGFSGVSFETVEATDSDKEKFLIYMDAEKSTWLSFQADVNSKITMTVCFKDGTSLSLDSGTNNYHQYNIVRTDYGVMFTKIESVASSAELITNDGKLRFVFATGSPNVFVWTDSDLITAGNSSNEYFYSNVHSIVEQFSKPNSLMSGTTTPRTQLFKLSSLVENVDCEHLYRLAYTDGRTGKIQIKDKYFIMGSRFALEYDPNSDGTSV